MGLARLPLSETMCEKRHRQGMSIFTDVSSSDANKTPQKTMEMEMSKTVDEDALSVGVWLRTCAMSWEKSSLNIELFAV